MMSRLVGIPKTGQEGATPEPSSRHGALKPVMRAVAVLLVLALVPLAGCAHKDKAPTEAEAPPPCDPCEDCGLYEAVCVTQPLPPTAPLYPHFPNDGAVELTSLEIPSFDAHQIPMTVYRPKVADAAHPVPMVLHSHGFTGKRATDPDAFKPLVSAGFGVISFDERGHGDSMDDSEVQFMDPDYEVKDVARVVDYAASLDWVLREDNSTAAVPGDIVLGAIGGSYGGAYQLMGAIFDPRFDAIVPEITWNDITEALAPHGAIKSGWVDLFYAAGNAQRSVKFSQDFHEGWAWTVSTNLFPNGTYGEPDLYTRLKASSPVSYPGRLTIPTLLVQGMPDTLFPLNQAVANLRLLEAAGVPANETALYTHLGGHILNTASLAPQVPRPVGLQGVPGGKPCGELADLQVAWLSRFLLLLDNTTGPRVCLSLEDGSNVVGPGFPLPGTTMQSFDLGGPTPVAQAAAGPSVDLPLLTADKDTIVAGIPTVRGTLTAPGPDTIVYFSLRVPSRGDAFESIVDDQVMPFRLKAPATSAVPFQLDLGGVGVRLKAGEQLVLTVATVEPMYFGNAERVPGAAVVDDLVLDLPIVPADSPSLVLPAK
jgi:alpha-beta hydrolase superfamily lysophospholipase